MSAPWSRRQMLGASVALGAGALALTTPATETVADDRPSDEPFGYCLNTATLRGHKLGLVAELEIAARVGYKAVEPWISELEMYAKEGGSLDDLAKRIVDLGLTVESVIGFAEWLVDDEARRLRGLERARQDMELSARIGGKRLACPPAGAVQVANLDLGKAAERYRALVEIGRSVGVVPQVELWGHSKCLCRLGEVTYVAIESGCPEACILLDVYHLHKGGSNVEGLRLLNGQAVHVMHMNDYPAEPARKDITDAHRVYPGDGVAPFAEIFGNLRRIGFRGYLSLELFNREYWTQDPMLVAREGFDKMRATVRKSLASSAKTNAS